MPEAVIGTFTLPEITLVYRVLCTLDFQQKFEHEVVAVEISLVKKYVYRPLSLNLYQLVYLQSGLCLYNPMY